MTAPSEDFDKARLRLRKELAARDDERITPTAREIIRGALWDGDEPPEWPDAELARDDGTYDFRRARGAIRPAPGTPPAEDVIRRIRDDDPIVRYDALEHAVSGLRDAANPALDRDALEAELRRMWAADQPPEQVDIDAMAAWLQVEHADVCDVCGSTETRHQDREGNVWYVCDRHPDWHGEQRLHHPEPVVWPPQTRSRAVVAWVGLAIGLASVAAIFFAIAILLGWPYRPL